MNFKKLRLEDGENIKDIIKQAFGVNIDVKGNWGYTKDTPIVLKSSNEAERKQLQFTFAMMRATLEMTLTQPEESRYTGINIKEIVRDILDGIEKVVFEVSGMKESDYNRFIQEYKEGFGKDDFDIDKHFEDRKKATLTREVEYFFKI